MKKTMIVLIAMMMCMPILSLATAVADGPTTAAREDSRQGVPLANVNAMSYTQTRYPGQNEDFYLRTNNIYDGSYYNSVNPAPWDYQYLFGATFAFGPVLDSNYNTVSYPVVAWVISDISDNAGAGWDMNTWNNYDLYDPGWNYFEFIVVSSEVHYGRYYIEVQITADVVVDFDGIATYTYSTHTDTEYIALDIANPVGYGGLDGVNNGGGQENIYAGAKNERVGLSIWSVSGTITDITGTLDIPDSHFGIVNPQHTATSIGVGATYDLYWFIDVDVNTPPGWYDAEVMLEYERNGILVTEANPITVQFAVQWTPLLHLPDSNGFTEPLRTLVQNSPPETLNIPVTNIGNVHLKDVSVRIDLDNARYYTNGDFYYNENNYGAVNYLDLTVKVGDINRGETVQVPFSDVILKDNLPPGKYMIPIDYIGYYYDNGTLGTSDYVSTGYWDEIGEWDYQTIHIARDDPQPAAPFFPFVYVEVVDDDIGIDIYGTIDTVYSPGDRNRYITMVVNNKEMYSFTSAYYWVHVDGGSPLKRVGAPDNDMSVTLPPTYGGTLSASNTDNVYFYADIKQDLQPGTHYIQVDMEAYNPQQRLIKHTFETVMVINALTPSIQSMNTECNVTPEGIGAVTVTLKNVAFGGARNLTLYFESSSTGIKGIDAPVRVGNLMPGSSVDYTFHVTTTSESASIWGTYYGYIYFEYLDDGGSIRKLFSSGSEYISYTFQPKLPDFRVTNVDAPAIKPGQKFDVTVDITNTGGGTALNTSVMFVSNNAQFTLLTAGKFYLGEMKPGQNYSLQFTMKASKALFDGTTYTLNLYFTFTRVNGYELTYTDGDHETFQVHTIDEVEVNREEQVVEYVNPGQSVDYGMIILGIFIFLSVVVGMSIYTKTKGGNQQAAYMAEMDRPASSSPIDDSEPQPRMARPVDEPKRPLPPPPTR